jgi:ubiquinone/menaquinone biosynthesis C-methylase UbiE
MIGKALNHYQLTARDLLSQPRTVSRRTFLVMAAAGAISSIHTGGCARRHSTAPQEDDLWHLSGNASDRYQQYLVPAVFAPWAADLIARVDLRPNDHILDVACGTGVVARLAAARLNGNGGVTALDFSPEMLAVARALPPVPGPAIDWREGDAMALPFQPNTFHRILCQQGLQFFPDRSKALTEMYRVLVPDGRAAVSVFCGLEKNPYPAALASAIARHLGVDSAEPLRAPFAFENRDDLGSLLARAGFRGAKIDDVELEMHVSPLRDFIIGHLSVFGFFSALMAKDSGERRMLIDEVLRSLKPYTTGTELRVPWRAVVGIGTK